MEKNRQVTKIPIQCRPPTGSMQFEDDWPGLFVRGDDAIGLIIALEDILSILKVLEEQGKLRSLPYHSLARIVRFIEMIEQDVLVHGDI